MGLRCGQGKLSKYKYVHGLRFLQLYFFSAFFSAFFKGIMPMTKDEYAQLVGSDDFAELEAAAASVGLTGMQLIERMQQKVHSEINDLKIKNDLDQRGAIVVKGNVIHVNFKQDLNSSARIRRVLPLVGDRVSTAIPVPFKSPVPSTGPGTVFPYSVS